MGNPGRDRRPQRQEHLAVSDTGVVMLRKLLDEQISVVEAGGEPMNVLRDPAKNTIIEFKSHTVRAFQRRRLKLPEDQQLRGRRPQR